MRALNVTGTLRVTTPASVWIIEADRYMRLPRSESPRWLPCVDDALDDAIWHAHVGVFAEVDGDGDTRVRLLPAGRPAGSAGVVTGVVLYSRPPLADLEDTDFAPGAEETRTANPSEPSL